jgi:hypothetical protein
MSPFPLPLVAFEHYMLADDRLSHPMTFFFRLMFLGRFDKQRFHQAMNEALHQHPLLHAHIRGSADSKTSGLAWVKASNLEPMVSWNGEESPINFQNGVHIDLRRETGIRIWVNEGKERTTLLVQIHHSCSDGIGAIHFIETLLATYANQTCSTFYPSSKGSANRSVLRNRGRPGMGLVESGQRLWRDLPKIARFFLSSPRPVLGRRSATTVNTAPAARPGLISHSFEEAETEQICSAAKQKEVTVNDLLLRDVFVTLNIWNRQHTPGHYGGTLRISMPMNLRSTTDRGLPAVNNVSMVFLDRHSSNIADPETLLRGIQAETQAMKQGHWGLTLLSVLRFVGAVPRGLRMILGGLRCLNSSVLSNLGIPFADSPLRGPGERVYADDLILEVIEFFPPIRPQTNVAFGVVSYGKRLVVGLNYDRSTLSAEDAKELLGAFTDQIRRTIGGGPTGSEKV